MHKVMLIDDEKFIHNAVRKLLENHGYTYCGAFDGNEGMRVLASERPDLLLLDVMLPGTNGFDLCRQIREEGRFVPIIFLSAKDDIVDKSIGFRAGGDDYVVKPFDAAELLLRIEANIRRHEDQIGNARKDTESAAIHVGDLEIRPDEYQVYLRGEPVPLTNKEYEIVALLASAPGKVFTRAEIYESLWNERYDDSAANGITVFMRRIREKIEENPSKPTYLLTVQRIGYKIANL